MSQPTVAHDLALKRTVHTPVEQKPHFAWRDVVAGAAIAAGGWLFHKVVKDQTKLQLRLNELEKTAARMSAEKKK